MNMTSSRLLTKSVSGLAAVLVILGSLLGYGVHPVEASGLSGWANQIQITLDHTKVEAALSDFPVLVHLSSASGANRADLSAIFDNLGPNSKKIAVTIADGTSQCYVEVQKWDSANKQAYLWVKVPGLSSTADTNLYLYYNNSQADNTAYIGDTGSSPARNVWDSSYTGVWHLSENGGPYKDATGRGNSAVAAGGSPNRVVDEKGRDVQSFNGSMISIPEKSNLDMSITHEMTFQAWISPDKDTFVEKSSDNWVRWMQKAGTDSAEYNGVMYNLAGSPYPGKGSDGGDRPGRSSFYIYSPDGGNGAGGGFDNNNLGVNDWLFFTGEASMDARVTWAYENGIRQPMADSWNAGFLSSPLQYVYGEAPINLGSVPSSGTWSGRIGEVRISNINRSEAWVKADYYSENDSLVSFGSSPASGTGSN